MKIPKLLLLFFLISLGLKLAFGIVAYEMHSTKNFVDDWDYISYANQIIEQGIWVLDSSKLKDGGVGMGLGMILAIMFSIFGENYLVVIILNAILGALLTIIIFFIGRYIFNAKVGLLASFWTIPYVLYYQWIPRVLKEMWIFVLFALVIYLVLLESEKKRITVKILLVATLFTLLIHIDERFFIYFPLIILIFLISGSSNLKIASSRCLIFFILLLTLMVPWTLRNYKVYDRIVILTPRSDLVLDYIFKKKSIFKKKDRFYLSNEQINAIAMGKETYNRSPLEIDRIKRGIVPHKYSILERWYNEFFEFWAPARFNPGYVGGGYRFEARSFRNNLSIFLSYGILLPFFVLGTFLIFKEKNLKGIIIFSIILIHTVSHVLIFWVRSRYRVPIDIFIIILASYGFFWVYDKFKAKKNLDRNMN